MASMSVSVSSGLKGFDSSAGSSSWRRRCSTSGALGCAWRSASPSTWMSDSSTMNSTISRGV
jgi:hypothetical protein